jgi:hypothetical protein
MVIVAGHQDDTPYQGEAMKDEEEEIESKLKAYATELIRGYSDALENNYSYPLQKIIELGFGPSFFPLYGREPGKNIALAVLYTQYDYYLFLLDAPDTLIKICILAGDAEGFDIDWTHNTPDDKRADRVKEFLGISDIAVLELVNVPGTDFMSGPAALMVRDGYTHGNSRGNQAGAKAEQELPRILEDSQRTAQLLAFGERYKELLVSTGSFQARGQEFEKLWREVLDFYGWKTKKIRIPGEENDFTAIYQGLHILGEVRWFNEPMNGGKLREFLGKLDPRPQTIGLFISHSGIDEGARSVVRRAVNSKTVVVFGRKEIEGVIMERNDPGAIFEEELRKVYDYVLEV